jgi:CDP-diglyceride synthetase
LGFEVELGPAEDGGAVAIRDLAGAVVHFAAVFNFDQQAVVVGPALDRVGGGGTATFAQICISMIRWTTSMKLIACCAVFAAWEWLVMTRTPDANIRVDLLLIWPALLLLTLWSVWQALRRRA